MSGDLISTPAVGWSQAHLHARNQKFGIGELPMATTAISYS